MAVAALLYAMIGLLAGAIGLLAATSVPLQIRPTAEGSIVTSQYCVPPNDGIGLHEVYCRHEQRHATYEGILIAPHACPFVPP